MPDCGARGRPHCPQRLELARQAQALWTGIREPDGPRGAGCCLQRRKRLIELAGPDRQRLVATSMGALRHARKIVLRHRDRQLIEQLLGACQHLDEYLLPLGVGERLKVREPACIERVRAHAGTPAKPSTSSSSATTLIGLVMNAPAPL